MSEHREITTPQRRVAGASRLNTVKSQEGSVYRLLCTTVYIDTVYDLELGLVFANPSFSLFTPFLDPKMGWAHKEMGFAYFS